MQAFFGQRLSADINLAAQVLILLGLWVGWYFARRNQIAQHRAIQTTMVLVNLFFILSVMVMSFYGYIIAGGTVTGTVAQLMIVHGFLGLVAELAGIYLILRMTTHVIPPGLRIRNFRLLMRGVLGLWTVLVLLGFGIYYTRYLAPPSGAATPSITSFAQSVDDIQIHAEELAEAAARGNLDTGKRHAEHLINLIEGKGSADYGDADHNGVVEDPGDGTGGLVYLQRTLAAAPETGDQSAQARTAAGQLQASMIKIVADAKAFIEAGDLSRTEGVVSEIGSLAGQIKDSPAGSLVQLAQLLGGVPAQPAMVMPSLPSVPSSVTVAEKDFAFSPKSLQVKKGTTVIWVNEDRAKHTVTSDTDRFDSGGTSSGQTYSFKFDEVGTFAYYCLYHGDKGGVGMAGTVTVAP